VDPRERMDVGEPVQQRLSPTMIAAIALGLLVLVIVGTMVLRSSSGDDDRLTGARTAQGEDPEKLCASQATYDLIKREMFRRASALRGSDKATFDAIGGYSSIRIEAPMMTDENGETGSVTCSGTLTVDLPPGVSVVGGRRSLSTELTYAVQPAADGTGNVVTLTNAEGIITPLATLAKTAAPPVDDAVQNGVGNDVVTSPVAPIDPLAPTPDAVQPPANAGTANPSFSCSAARSSGEVAVCNNPGLAALDRRMASQFNSAMAGANPQQRAVLSRTRDAFLRYRDQCPSNDCIAQTYQGRMREIRDIMRGDWQAR
jgi:uncharacterized protein YecT (DUF1311 family)